MGRLLVGAALLAATSMIATTSTAIASTMLDDTLTFHRAYPDVNTDFRPPVSTTVTADSSDLVILQPPIWYIDPGANNIFIDVNDSGNMIGSSTFFDGIVIRGFSETISNASASLIDPDNVASVFDLAFDGSSVALNLAGLFDGNETIDIRVDFASTVTAVPIPAALPLLGGGLGLMGLLGWRRRRKITAVA